MNESNQPDPKLTESKGKDTSPNKVVTWLERAKKSPVIAITVAVVGAITFLTTTTDLFKETYQDVQTQISPFDADYEKLSKLETGLSPDYVRDIFGNSSKVMEVCSVASCSENVSKDLMLHIYDFDSYQLRVIYEQKGVEFYSVTLKQTEFQPIIRYLDYDAGKLGYVTYSEATSAINPSIFPNDATIFMGAKAAAYVEIFAPGAPGDYQALYLAWAPDGYGGLEFSTDLAFELSDNENDPNLLQSFREVSQPNTYGIFDNSDGFGYEISKDTEALMRLLFAEY